MSMNLDEAMKTMQEMAEAMKTTAEKIKTASKRQKKALESMQKAVLKIKKAVECLGGALGSGDVPAIDVTIDEPVGPAVEEMEAAVEAAAEKADYDYTEAYPIKSDFSNSGEFLKFQFLPKISRKELAQLDIDELLEKL